MTDNSITEGSPTIAVIDYGMGNLRSVGKAFEHLGAAVTIVTDPESAEDADGLVLPGVGALGDCIKGLKATGFDDLTRHWISRNKPFLGVCLGLQALFDYSEEGDTEGLGIFPGKVVRFRLPSEFKIPHMGWNTLHWKKRTPLDRGLADGLDQFYFVHSYYVAPDKDEIIWGEANYGGPFTAAICSGNCYATQFHPEKSQAKGLQIYGNFMEMVKSCHYGE